MLKRNSASKEKQGTGRLRLWLLVGATGAAVLLSLCLVIALHLPAVQKVVIDRLVHQIESTAPVKLEIGEYRWWPFSNIRLLNLKVKSSGKDLLQCDQAQIAYHLSFDWPYLICEEVYLEKPVIHLEKDEKGRWELPSASPTEAGKEEPQRIDPAVLLRFPWPRIRIASGVLSAQQNGQSILTIRDVSGILSLHAVSGPNGPRIKVDLGQWQGLFEVPPWGAWNLSGEAEVDHESFSPVSLVLGMNEKSHVSCLGSFSLQPPYDMDLKLDLAPLSLASFPELHEKLSRLEDVSGTLHLERLAGIWSLDHEIHSGLGDFKGTGRSEVTAEGENLFHVSTRFTGLGIPGPAYLPNPHLFGHMEISLQGEHLKTMKGCLEGRLEPSRWGEQNIRKGDISGTYERGSLALDLTGVQSSLGDYSAALTADLEGLWNARHEGGLKLDLQLERASLEKVFPGVQQRVGGVIHLEAGYGPSQILNWQKWHAKGDTRLAIAGFASLKASGAYRNESLEVSYDLDADDLQKVSAFFPPWQGKGKLTSQGSFKGRWPDLFWEGKVNAPRLEYAGVQGEELALSGKGKITGKEARRDAILKVRNLTVDGKKVGSFDLELEQQENDCRFQVKGEQPWNQLSARLSGRMEKIWAPPRMLSFNPSQFSWKDQSGVVEGKVELGTDRIKLHSFNVQEGRQKAHLAGELSWEAKSELKLSLEEVNLGQWLRAFGVQEGLGGTAGGQIHITGTAEHPEASIDIQVANAALSVNPLEKSVSSNPPLESKGEEFKVQESKVASRQLKTKSGATKGKDRKQTVSKVSKKSDSVAAAGSGQAAVISRASAADQESREPKPGSQEPKAQNQAPSPAFRETFDRIQLQGTYARQILQIHGELQGQSAESPVSFWAKLPAAFSFKPFRAEVSRTDEWSSTLKVTGFRVERLLPYLDSLDKVGGRMDVEAQIGGTLAQPVVKANGLWRDGNFQVKGWPHPIENVQTEWQADSKQIYIRKAQMQHLGGRVDLTGRVEYPGFRVMEYQASGQDLEVPEFWGIKGKGVCDATLTQTAESALLKADIRLSKAEMNLREFETDLARTIQIVGGEAKGDVLTVRADEKEQGRYYSRLKMDLGVRLPSAGTWVKGKGLETEITGLLHLQKAVNAPLKLYGGLKALRGTYTFQGNKLTIVDGELAFFGSPQPDPILKIVCRKELKDVTVLAHVNGPLSQPKFSLSSVPAMNQVDVLSYLLFGHPAGDLNSKQTSQLQDGAVSWLSSQTSHMLQSVLGNTPLTPDTLQYRNTGNKGEGAVIEIGKYVTPDLYVTYGKDLKGEKENQVQVEYRLNRHLSIQTQIGGADQSGVDVFWRHDFGK